MANPRAATVMRSGPGLAALTPVLPRLGARLANATMAHDLLAHCGEEMNHLSRFLPELFQEFKDVP